jgi:Family of unknown function (DUF5519)
VRLLPVPLDGVGVPDLGLVRILPELLARPSLSEQVPAPVELDLDVSQAPLIFRQLVGLTAVRLLLATKLVLLSDQVLNPIGDAVVVHVAIVARQGYDRRMPRSDALVDDIANELATWPGVHIERRADGAARVRYEHSTLGLLYPELGVAELPVLDPEHDELIDEGEAEPAGLTKDSTGVSHDVHGPSDVTAVLELFDRRYRDVRGEDEPYSSEDPE